MRCKGKAGNVRTGSQSYNGFRTTKATTLLPAPGRSRESRPVRANTVPLRRSHADVSTNSHHSAPGFDGDRWRAARAAAAGGRFDGLEECRYAQGPIPRLLADLWEIPER